MDANLKGSVALTAGTEAGLTVTGLTGNIDYDIYLVAEDSVPNLQASPVKVTVRTMMTDSQAVDLDKEALEITYAPGDSGGNVTQNVTLPISGANGTTISWSSNNSFVVF